MSLVTPSHEAAADLVSLLADPAKVEARLAKLQNTEQRAKAQITTTRLELEAAAEAFKRTQAATVEAARQELDEIRGYITAARNEAQEITREASAIRQSASEEMERANARHEALDEREARLSAGQEALKAGVDELTRDRAKVTQAAVSLSEASAEAQRAVK